MNGRQSEAGSAASGGTARLIKPAGLRRRKEFLRVQRDGRRFRGPHVLLLVDPGDNPHGARVGFTVSRRVGNAVVRNTVRRRLREVVRTMPWLMCDGFDHVIVALPSARDASTRMFQEELSCLFRRAHLWASRRGRSSR